ncbi:hypothetical protein ABT297_40005 [Dactylosporangium sp. NPDC000555]|uniref:hypothetical protein n=1 Tax=Dactylosporangium sp. NPDC000555 TaxID=3154260 RepID=UPI00331DFD3C
METILNLLLIRFALIAAGVVVLALLVFAVALAVRRRGGMGEVRRYAKPVARTVVQYLDDRDGAPRTLVPSRRQALLGTVLRAVVRRLADDRNGTRRSAE